VLYLNSLSIVLHCIMILKMADNDDCTYQPSLMHCRHHNLPQWQRQFQDSQKDPRRMLQCFVAVRRSNRAGRTARDGRWKMANAVCSMPWHAVSLTLDLHRPTQTMICLQRYRDISCHCTIPHTASKTIHISITKTTSKTRFRQNANIKFPDAKLAVTMTSPCL